MERKYPPKLFLLFVLTNFTAHFFFLFFPGLLLLILGIWFPTCLWIGIGILPLGLVLSVVEQCRIRKAAISHSHSPEFNELMDAFCGPGGLKAVPQVLEEQRARTDGDPKTDPQP